MLKNYFLVALRSLKKNRSYIIINTFGLGIALACCVTAYLIVAFNVEFDYFHSDKKVERIFKVHTHLKEHEGKKIQNNNAPMPLAPHAAAEIAGIERYTRFVRDGGYMRNGDKAFSEGISFADSTFFEMFDFVLLQGDFKSFKDQYNIVITEEYAKKYFADEPALGKILTLNFTNNFEIQATVGAVIKKIPENSSFVFNVLMRIENLHDIHKVTIDNWGDWRDPSTFFEITKVENAENIGKQLAKYAPLNNEAQKDNQIEFFKLEHFKTNFTHDEIGWGYANMRIGAAPLIVFTVMAAIILLIACFNLTNTSIAMTGKRLKEVGVRKAVGALRQQIVSQFLMETILTITLSLIVGLLIAQWIVPIFTTMWDLPFSLKDLSGVNLVITLLVLVFFASLLAGIYPALFNSKFKPVALLKGQVKISGTNMLTRTLVAFQFALSVIVLIGGVVFIQNARFQEEVDFGYDKEKVLTVSIQSESDYRAFKNEIQSHPKIQAVAVSDHHVGYNNYQFPFTVDTAKYTAQLMGIGENYMETIGFDLLEGRFFNLENASDRNAAVVVNKALLDKIGMKDALDKIIDVHDKKRHIIGVVDNHVDNLFRSKDPEPFIFYPADSNALKMVEVRAEASDLTDVKQFLETTWKKTFPTKPFECQYQEDIVLKETKNVNGNLKKIFIFLTILGGLLSASGIFSLASLNIAKRTKEIGIRKALGASVSNVVLLLNKEFIIILTLAGALGSAGGYVLTDALLKEIYAYHIAVGILPVVACALIIFFIGIFTTSLTIFRAARANPVNTLRTE